MNRILGRLRVPGGPLIAVLLAAVVLFAAVLPLMAASPAKVVVASTGEWDTSLFVLATTPLEHDFGLCGVGPSAGHVAIAAGGAEVLRQFGPHACISGFALLDVPAAAEAFTVLSFAGEHRSSFVLGPIGAIDADEAVTVGPLISDVTEGSWITVFAVYPDTPVYIVLRDARGVAPDIVEKFKASPPVTQYRLQAPGLFFADVSLGTDPLYRCFPSQSCASYGPLYGFASSGDERGGTFRSWPFGGD